MFQQIDTLHQARERVVCCYRLGDVLIDPGPTSSLPNVLRALQSPPRAVLVTHIHLDHSGGVGALLREYPDLKVYVHERGAKHLIDPSRLIASAAQLYGDRMDILWGEILPVPEQNVTIVSGGEQVEGFAVEYTPGHASHHVSYFHADSGRAFTGDVAGIRIQPSDLVVLPTPPPDIDMAAWSESVDRIAAWQPSSLCPTHFGELNDVEEHIAMLREQIAWTVEMARSGDRERFFTAMHERIMHSLDAESAKSLEQAAPSEHLWLGLERYAAKHLGV